LEKSKAIELLEALLKDEKVSAPNGVQAIFESQNANVEKARQDCILEWGIDPAEKGMDIANPRFSAKKFLEQAQSHLNITENVSYSSLASVVRHGISKVITNLYQRQTFDWAKLVQVIPSDSWSEFMTAMYDTDIPKRVGMNEEADESKLIGRNFEITNYEYARILRVPKALVKDDQTGLIMQKATRFAQGMALREIKEVVKLYTSKSTWTTAGSGDVTGPNIRSGYNKLTKVQDPTGEYYVIVPSMLFVDSTRAFNADQIANSDWQTDQPDGVSGNTGYFQTKNVLKNRFDIVDLPHVTAPDLCAGGITTGADGVSPRWYLSQPGLGVYFTDREPLAVTQEDPMSGKSWSTRSIAWQQERRFGTLLVDDYGIYAGNG